MTEREALERVAELVLDLPSGIDRSADDNNPSPEDMTAHVGGLIWQVCIAALHVCWVCRGLIGEPYTDGDGGPVCCSKRCLRECRADMYGDDAGPELEPENAE